MSTEPDGHDRVLFVSAPYAGLINPLLVVAGELNRRGTADIWFASAEGRRLDVEKLAGQGGPVRFVSLGPWRATLDPVTWDDDTHRALRGGSPLSRYRTFMDKHLDHDYFEEKYRQMLHEIDKAQPALMVVDSNTTWAIEAAKVCGVPFVLSVPVPPSLAVFEKLPWGYPTPFSGLPRDMTVVQRIRNIAFRIGVVGCLLRPSQMRVAKAIRQRRVADGVPSAPSRFTGVDAARAVLAYSVFGLEYPFPHQPEHFRMLGAMIPTDLDDTQADGELADWLDRHDSVVYIGFGTIMRPDRELIEAIVDVAARLGPTHQVLWKLPEAQQELLPQSLPANLRVEEWVPSQLGVLAHPHVRVFFNHGGGNAIHEGLYFGKPLLVMPFWVDCHDYAVRAVDSGAALAVDGAAKPDAAEISTKLTQLLEQDAFRTRAQHWACQQHEAGGVSAAVDVIVAALGKAP